MTELELYETAYSLFNYVDGVLINRCTHGRAIKGKVAGRLSQYGYRRIKIGNKTYTAHGIIYLMHHGYTPIYIDHINGIRDDNRIENLREATLSQNQYNRKKNKTNTSGEKGVTFCKKLNKWRVRFNIEGKAVSFGYYEDLELASLVATEARDKYHKEFANHG